MVVECVNEAVYLSLAKIPVTLTRVKFFQPNLPIFLATSHLALPSPVSMYI